MFWANGRLHLFTTIGTPLQINTADSLFSQWTTQIADTTELFGKTAWMEAAWSDPDGTVFGWYHHEPPPMLPDSHLTVPKIGAVVSFDGGRTIHDMGFILESGDDYVPNAENGFFLGGHGDFSVVLDRESQYFYFFFSNYGGPVETQGVVVARLRFEDRFDPVGKVQKYFNGAWDEPGLGGKVTPIFPARRTWVARDPDAFWGPSVHWNTHLNRYVMMLNHAAGEPGWNQEGVYVSFSTDISQPESWKEPYKILDQEDLSDWYTFYPQVVGLGEGGTDTYAGKKARFFMRGESFWEIEFFNEDEDPDSIAEAIPMPESDPEYPGEFIPSIIPADPAANVPALETAPIVAVNPEPESGITPNPSEDDRGIKLPWRPKSG